MADDDTQAKTIHEAILLVRGLKELYQSERDGHRREHDTLRSDLTEFKFALNEKLKEMNNLRDQVTAERGAYVTRDRLEAELKAVEVLEARVSAAERLAGTVAGRAAGSSASWGQIVTVCLLVLQTVSVLVVLYRLH